jgi:hypothetical protein
LGAQQEPLLQTAGLVQLPQFTVWPQLFVFVPQVAPPQVVVALSGVQHVPPEVQTWPAAQQVPLPQLQAALTVAPTVQVPTHWPPQLVWPDGQPQLVPVPEHTPPVGHVTQLPPQQSCPELQVVHVPAVVPQALTVLPA